MRTFLLCLFALSVLCETEISLAKDSSNPYGVNKLIARIELATPLSSYSSVYKDLPASQKILPASVDHRSWIGPIRLQSWTSADTDVGCGSCVTFAAIAAAEVAYYKKFKKVPGFSEMDLVDCMYHAGGCNGNYMPDALKHIFNNGLTYRTDYPYKPSDLDVCDTSVPRHFKNRFIPFKINQKKPEEWKSFINIYGGIGVRMYIGSFRKNSDGIVVDCDGASSNKGRTNHAVSAFGYGRIHGVDYILIRNSWGEDAYDHEKGYFKLKVGACNSHTYDHYGFIYDSCYSYTDKNSCTADVTCGWSFGSCTNKYISFTNSIVKTLSKVANKIDSLIDRLNGVGLCDISVTHVLRKNVLIGSEFMCFMKRAGKNKDAATVISWFNKAASAGYVNKTTGKITNYKKLRSLLGITFAFKTFIATKANLAAKYKQMDEYRFHLLHNPITYWDSRYNQNEFSSLYLVLGTCKDGVKSMNKIDWSKQ